MQTNLFEKSIVGEVHLSYAKRKEIFFPSIHHSKDIETFIRSIFPQELINYREYAYAILLNRANNILGYFKISSGGISGTVIDTRVVFQAALLSNASAFVLFHNHPSGSLKPSEADISITKKIAQAGKLLDIPLLDHLIITEDSYYSFSDNNEIVPF